MLPKVDFCGIKVSRLILGANPFGGFSHQNKDRDEAMRAYYTMDRIKETWKRAEAVGINTMITNNTTPHVVQAVRDYIATNGSLQWIAQVNGRDTRDIFAAIDQVVSIGCKALYFHGALIDEVYRQRDDKTIGSWCKYARAAGVPTGVAGHVPEAHVWVDSLDVTDFHAICLFNCGSLHHGQGDKFRLCDMAPAVDCIRRIQKPCIAYKIMGAGRIDPRMAFEYAFEQIKPADVVNVGIYRGDKDNMVEENAVIVRDILCCQVSSKV